MALCRWCTKAEIVYAGVGRPPDYCSKECKTTAQAYRDNPTRTADEIITNKEEQRTAVLHDLVKRRFLVLQPIVPRDTVPGEFVIQDGGAFAWVKIIDAAEFKHLQPGAGDITARVFGDGRIEYTGMAEWLRDAKGSALDLWITIAAYPGRSAPLRELRQIKKFIGCLDELLTELYRSHAVDSRKLDDGTDWIIFAIADPPNTKGGAVSDPALR